MGVVEVEVVEVLVVIVEVVSVVSVIVEVVGLIMIGLFISLSFSLVNNDEEKDDDEEEEEGNVVGFVVVVVDNDVDIIIFAVKLNVLINCNTINTNIIQILIIVTTEVVEDFFILLLAFDLFLPFFLSFFSCFGALLF